MNQPFALDVFGFHCDVYGHVNNARYLEFLEAARWKALDETVGVERWHAAGRQFVVVKIEVSYRAAATNGDRLSIRTWRGEAGGMSARVHQSIDRVADGVRVVDATITYVILDEATGKPIPIRGEIAEGLARIPELQDLEP